MYVLHYVPAEDDYSNIEEPRRLFISLFSVNCLLIDVGQTFISSPWEWQGWLTNGLKQELRILLLCGLEKFSPKLPRQHANIRVP